MMSFLWNGPTEEMSLPGLKPRTAALDEVAPVNYIVIGHNKKK
jgi:hypothetical protein